MGENSPIFINQGIYESGLIKYICNHGAFKKKGYPLKHHLKVGGRLDFVNLPGKGWYYKKIPS